MYIIYIHIILYTLNIPAMDFAIFLPMIDWPTLLETVVDSDCSIPVHHWISNITGV